jgi:hypothetical protein
VTPDQPQTTPGQQGPERTTANGKMADRLLKALDIIRSSEAGQDTPQKKKERITACGLLCDTVCSPTAK